MRGLLTALSAAGWVLSLYYYSVITLRPTYDPICRAGSVGSITLDCIRVSSSPHSTISVGAISIDVPTAAITWFLVSLILSILFLATESKALVRLLSLLSGCCSALVPYLIYVELCRIGSLCLYCTAMQSLVVAIFVASLMTSVKSDGKVRS